MEIQELFVKEVTSELSEEDKSLLEKMIASDKSAAREYAQLKAVWEKTGKLRSETVVDSEKGWANFQSRKMVLKVSKNFKPVYRWVSGIAASLLLLMVVQFFFATKQVTLITEAQKQKVTLNDGSVIWLNANSQLDYPQKFWGGTREVRLKGEAFFDVAHDSDKPFRIETEHSKITVLGTSFNVRARETESLEQVDVTTGKVRVENEVSDKVDLAKGQTAMLEIASGKLAKVEKQDANYLAWKTGVLTFDKTPFPQVVNRLSSHFKMSISLKNNELDSCSFSSKFDNESLENILEELKLVFAVEVKKEDGKWIIEGGGC